MATSTFALPVKATLFKDSQHERTHKPTSRFSSSSHSVELGSLPERSPRLNYGAQSSSARAEKHQSYDALGISEAKSWESRTSGPAVSMRENGKSRARGESDLGRRASLLQTNGFTFPMSPLSPRTPMQSRYIGVFECEPCQSLTLTEQNEHAARRDTQRSPTTSTIPTSLARLSRAAFASRRRTYTTDGRIRYCAATRCFGTWLKI